MLVSRGLAKHFDSYFCYCNTPCLEWTIKLYLTVSWIYISNKGIFKTLAKWIAWLVYINVNTARKLTMYIILKTSEAWTCTRYSWFPNIYSNTLNIKTIFHRISTAVNLHPLYGIAILTISKRMQCPLAFLSHHRGPYNVRMYSSEPLWSGGIHKST